jgi:hypothetical protein
MSKISSRVGRLAAFLLISWLVLVMVGCQDVFTFSPFTGLQRDISDLSPEQQISYAQGILETGDTDKIKAAYEQISALVEDVDPEDDPDLYLLAADMAIGASGLTDVLTDFVSGGVDPENPPDFEEIIGEYSEEELTDMVESISEAGGYIEAVAGVEGATISSSQYVVAGAGIVVGKIAEADGDMEAVDWEDPEIITAIEYAELGGVDMNSYFGTGR